MKIAVCIASRERPAALIGVVMSLHRMKSTKHEIEFVLGVDDDDETKATVGAAFLGELSPVLSIMPQPRVRGMIENRMIGEMGGADAVTLMSDRTFNITPGWDEWLARAVELEPNRVLWWQCPEDAGCVIPIIPAKYLTAIDGRWSAEIFPFWWEDTWHQEIDLMIHGAKSKKARCTYSGARGATANGREFAFWLNVFVKTRPRRRHLARKIAGLLDVPFVDRPDIDAYFAHYDELMRSRCDEFETRFKDPREPGPHYIEARAKAEQMLTEELQ